MARDRSGRATRPAVSACIALATVVVVAGGAWAGFAATTTPVAHDVATATLAAPTSPSVVNGSCTPVTGPVQADLAWSPSASSFADGYEILRSLVPGGPYTSVGTVVGQAASTFADGTVSFSTTYYYVVKATKLAWRSAASSEVSLTTPSVLCI